MIQDDTTSRAAREARRSKVTVERKPELRMTPSEHEKREWRRMATAAYAEDRNDIGHRYSSFGALRIEESIPLAVFDTLQINYRSWLITGFDEQAKPKYSPHHGFGNTTNLFD